MSNSSDVNSYLFLYQYVRVCVCVCVDMLNTSTDACPNVYRRCRKFVGNVLGVRQEPAGTVRSAQGAPVNRAKYRCCDTSNYPENIIKGTVSHNYYYL